MLMEVKNLYLIGLLKQETDVFFIALFHQMTHIKNICAQLSESDAWKVMFTVIKIVQ